MMKDFLAEGRFRMNTAVTIGLIFSGVLTGCAGKPPVSAPSMTDNASVSSICADAAQKTIAGSAGAEAVRLLCGYKDSVSNSANAYFYDGGAETYAPYFYEDSGVSSAEDKLVQGTDGGGKLFTFSMYTGVLAAGQKPGDVADVIRLQAFFPTEFKQASFGTDPVVTYTPKNVVAKDFNKIDYGYYKESVGNERPKVDYSGSLTFIPFGQAGTAVVDKIVTENGGAMKSLTGVLLIYPRGNDTIVIGRSRQAVRGEQQDWAAVKKNVTADMNVQVKRDFANYAQSAKAATIMAGKRK